jgi:hypothetical protein
LTNRVLIAIQNPGANNKGALQFVDAFYDIRSGFNGKPAVFSIAGFSGALPASIQNMPEEQSGAVYSSGDGSFTTINYGSESANGTASGLNGLSSSIFITRSQTFVFAASQAAHVLTVIDKSAGTGGSYALSLPGVYRVSVNPGGSMALAFVQNSNYVYYPIKLSAAQTTNYSGGPPTWPKAAVDCEPLNAPGWCLFQAQSPDKTDATGNYYGAPLVFDRPVKAVFSPDGGTAYVLSCGPECGANDLSHQPGLREVADQRHAGELQNLYSRRCKQCSGRLLHSLRGGAEAAAGGRAHAVCRQSHGGESQQQHCRQRHCHQRRRNRRAQPHARGRQ